MDTMKPTQKPPQMADDIYTVSASKKEEIALRSKYTKAKFTSYDVEYIGLTIFSWVMALWFAWHMVAQVLMAKNIAFSVMGYDVLSNYDNFAMNYVWEGVILGDAVFPSKHTLYWKIAFLVFFVPLTYLEFRKTISTHKDAYRVAWHQLFKWNAFMNYIVIAASIYVCGSLYEWDYFYMWIALPFVHFTIWGFHDLFKYVLPIFVPGVYLNVINDNEETATYYEFMKVATTGAYGAGIDLGFNLYDSGLPTEDYTRSPFEAQQAKFHHAFEKLDLKKGMKVIDIGCGMGDWLYWLKNEKDCKVIGLNITMGHADVVEDRGIPCLRGSWQSFLAKVEAGDKEFIGRYCNQFDCVTCWDTIEHYVKGKDVWNVKVIKKTYRDLFKLAHSLLDKNSECGSFWSSTLHQSRRLETNPLKYRFWLEWGNCYIMNCMYNGMYPTDIPTGSVCKGLKERASPQFKLKYESDRIEDYRMTSIINPNHFGNFTVEVNLRFLYQTFVEFLAHPHAGIVWFNAMWRPECCWMWHVGGIKTEIAPDCPTKLLWQAFEFDRNVDSYADDAEEAEPKA